MKTRIIMLFIPLIFGPQVGFAGGQFEAQTLKGIKSMFVIVEDIDEDGKKIGLTQSNIRTDVELKLRLAGIKVVSQEEQDNDALGTYLYVNVNVIAGPSGGLAESVQVSFNQPVTLARNNFATIAKTWEVGGVRTFPTETGTRTSVKDMVDRFLNDWLSVNPK